MPNVAYALPTVNPAIAAAERAIIATEGPDHVGGLRIRDRVIAAMERRALAERHVSAAERHAAWIATHPCVWCGSKIAAGTDFTMMGGSALHPECVRAFDDAFYEPAVAA